MTQFQAGLSIDPTIIYLIFIDITFATIQENYRHSPYSYYIQIQTKIKRTKENHPTTIPRRIEVLT